MNSSRMNKALPIIALFAFSFIVSCQDTVTDDKTGSGSFIESSLLEDRSVSSPLPIVIASISPEGIPMFMDEDVILTVGDQAKQNLVVAVDNPTEDSIDDSIIAAAFSPYVGSPDLIYQTNTNGLDTFYLLEGGMTTEFVTPNFSDRNRKLIALLRSEIRKISLNEPMTSEDEEYLSNFIILDEEEGYQGFLNDTTKSYISTSIDALETDVELQQYCISCSGSIPDFGIGSEIVPSSCSSDNSQQNLINFLIDQCGYTYGNIGQLYAKMGHTFEQAVLLSNSLNFRAYNQFYLSPARQSRSNSTPPATGVIPDAVQPSVFSSSFGPFGFLTFLTSFLRLAYMK